MPKVNRKKLKKIKGTIVVVGKFKRPTGNNVGPSSNTMPTLKRQRGKKSHSEIVLGSNTTYVPKRKKTKKRNWG